MKSYEIAADIKPTERQLKWQEMGFYAIIYYGMNTFTGREIGDGFAVPEMFCPEEIDTDEWANTVRDAAMSGIILTAKQLFSPVSIMMASVCGARKKLIIV